MSLQVHTDFAADLAAITVVDQMTEGRVYPLLIGATAQLPAISYQIRDGDREAFYRDSFGLEIYNVQLDIYSDSYVTNQTIYDAIIDRFNGFSGVIGTGTDVQRIIVASTLNSVDSDDPSIYRTILELTLTV